MQKRMNLELDWNTIILSTALYAGVSGAVGYSIAWYFRNKVKLKHEEVFDGNRQSNLRILFNGIYFLDFEFESFISIYERDLDELTKERENIIPRMEFQPLDQLDKKNAIDLGELIRSSSILEDVRQRLTPILERMQKQQKDFLRDYHIFLNYIHEAFLRDINSNYFTTIYYCQLLLEGSNYYNIGIQRKILANKITETWKKTNQLIKMKNISEFIHKWNLV